MAQNTDNISDEDLRKMVWEGKPSNSLLPSGERDWDVFLQEMLNGGFAYDVLRIGSTSGFIKNQLHATKNHEENKKNLKDALLRLIDKTAFTAEDALQKPSEYKLILEWARSEFLVREPLAANKVASLLNDLSIESLENDSYKQVLRSCAGTINAIAAKKENENSDAVSAVLTPENQKNMETVWKNWLQHEDGQFRAFGCIGLNHAQKWNEIEQNDRYDFIKKFSENKDMLWTTFSPIVFDMNYLPATLNVDYSYLAKDICHAAPELAKYIEIKAKEWYDKPEADYPCARIPSPRLHA